MYSDIIVNSVAPNQQSSQSLHYMNHTRFSINSNLLGLVGAAENPSPEGRQIPGLLRREAKKIMVQLLSLTVYPLTIIFFSTYSTTLQQCLRN